MPTENLKRDILIRGRQALNGRDARRPHPRRVAVHVAVVNGGRIFDAYTGAPGMTWAEYQVAMQSMGTLKYAVLP